jgi:hypothetical protein
MSLKEAARKSRVHAAQGQSRFRSRSSANRHIMSLGLATSQRGRTMKLGHIVGILLIALTAHKAAYAQEKPKKDASWLLPIPEVDADPKIPTLKSVIGHRWAEEISSHAEIEHYVRARGGGARSLQAR